MTEKEEVKKIIEILEALKVQCSNENCHTCPFNEFCEKNWTVCPAVWGSN